MRRTPRRRARCAGVCAVYLLRLDAAAGLFVDDACYIVLAKSLAQGDGFRLISSATTPILPAFPPGFPMLLAPVVWREPELSGQRRRPQERLDRRDVRRGRGSPTSISFASPFRTSTACRHHRRGDDRADAGVRVPRHLNGHGRGVVHARPVGVVLAVERAGRAHRRKTRRAVRDRRRCDCRCATLLVRLAGIAGVVAGSALSRAAERGLRLALVFAAVAGDVLRAVGDVFGDHIATAIEEHVSAWRIGGVQVSRFAADALRRRSALGPRHLDANCPAGSDSTCQHRRSRPRGDHAAGRLSRFVGESGQEVFGMSGETGIPRIEHGRRAGDRRRVLAISAVAVDWLRRGRSAAIDRRGSHRAGDHCDGRASCPRAPSGMSCRSRHSWCSIFCAAWKCSALRSRRAREWRFGARVSHCRRLYPRVLLRGTHPVHPVHEIRDAATWLKEHAEIKTVTDWLASQSNGPWQRGEQQPGPGVSRHRAQGRLDG